MKPDRRPVSIEDLLRLKRAEQPTPEFWAEFDRQLRAKQLAALVEKRPWWQRLPQLFGGLARYQLPIGAAALIAITAVSVRTFDFSSTSETPTAPESRNTSNTFASERTSLAEAMQLARETAASAVEEPVLAVDEPANYHVASTEEAEPEPRSREVYVADAAPAAGELSRMIPLLGVPAAESAAEHSPAAAHIAANLAVVQSAHPVVGRGLLGARLAEREVSSRPAIEPLQQITPPAEPRRSRLLTAMVTMTSMDAPERIMQRAASRIDDEGLYTRNRGRFGAEGDRMHIRF